MTDARMMADPAAAEAAAAADAEDLRAGIAAVRRAMAAGWVDRERGEAEIARMTGLLDGCRRTAPLFGVEARTG